MGYGFLIKCEGVAFRVVADTAEDALKLLKKTANNRRAAGRIREQWATEQGQFNIEFSFNPDVESLTLDDVKPDDDLVEAVRASGCQRCGGKLVDGEHGLKCERCGAEPCACEGCEGPHCRRCGGHTWGDTYCCESCDIWDYQYTKLDPKELARMLAADEMDACIKAGLSTDHIPGKYGLDGS